MKTSTTALAALLAATIGTTAIVPAANAQQSAGDVTIETAGFAGGHMRMMHGGGFNIIDLVCSPQGAEELEIGFVRLSHRLELTDAQQPLFDALKTSALTAQTSFADTCAAAMPDKSTDTAPDMIDRLKARIAIDTARLEALNAVLPDLEAFYDSLTDEQKANLLPDRGDRGEHRMMLREFRDMGPGRMERGPAPGR